MSEAHWVSSVSSQHCDFRAGWLLTRQLRIPKFQVLRDSQVETLLSLVSLPWKSLGLISSRFQFWGQLQNSTWVLLWITWTPLLHGGRLSSQGRRSTWDGDALTWPSLKKSPSRMISVSIVKWGDSYFQNTKVKKILDQMIHNHVTSDNVSQVSEIWAETHFTGCS